jgi:hypothetical protein
MMSIAELTLLRIQAVRDFDKCGADGGSTGGGVGYAVPPCDTNLYGQKTL